MFKNDKKMKVLISSVIAGDKAKVESAVREIVELKLLEKEQTIFESYFGKLEKGTLNG